MAKKTNVLWIQTDEQRPDSLGCYGSKWAKTPNIDLLAQRGVVMQKCVCQSPVCTPSRASQLTCLYPQECNVMLNEVADGGTAGLGVPGIFPAGTVTFPEIFAQAGYQTATIGKIHTPKHPIWQHIEQTALVRKYADYDKLGTGYDEDKYKLVRFSPKGVIYGGIYPTFLENPSRKNTDDALEYMRKREPDRPFLLRVSYNWPHTPVLPPPPFDRLYDTDEIPIEYFDEKAAQSYSDYNKQISMGKLINNMPRDQYRQMWKDYFSLVGYADYEVGRLLAGLKALGLEDDTIILFSSDHGRGLGELGNVAKHTFDEQIWRVPFIWHWPRHLPEGEIRNDLSELIDTGRTLLSLAGLGDLTPTHWRGRNLFGSEPPEAVFGEIGWPNRQAPIMQIAGIKALHERQGEAWNNWIVYRLMRVGVRTQRYRMDVSWMKDGRRVPESELDGNLIDLEVDPKEKQNLWNDPKGKLIAKKLIGRLEKWFEGLDKPTLLFG